VTSAARTHHLSPWGRLVTVCAVLVLGCLLALSVAALASTKHEIVSFPVRGSVNGVVLDLGGADVGVGRGGRNPGVDVQRTERYAFDHQPVVRRQVSGGIFRLRSRCPATVLHSCSVSYRVLVPDNVPIDVRTGGGSVQLVDYRGSGRIATRAGDISITGFCGFSLQARTEQGDISATTECAPQLSLRSRTGSVHAVVPPGRYRIDAETASGSRHVMGVTETTDAPFTIQALSSSGDVLVEGRE
jgi:hypothetical protein